LIVFHTGALSVGSVSAWRQPARLDHDQRDRVEHAERDDAEDQAEQQELPFQPHASARQRRGHGAALIAARR
jgi:hypothetical protein